MPKKKSKYMMVPTPEEYEYLIMELAERFKDTVVSDGRRLADEVLRKGGVDKGVEDNLDFYNFCFTIKLVAGDFRQIIARYRRTPHPVYPIGYGIDPVLPEKRKRRTFPDPKLDFKKWDIIDTPMKIKEGKVV